MKPSALPLLVAGVMLVAGVAVQAKPARMIKYVHLEGPDAPVVNNQLEPLEDENNHIERRNVGQEITTTLPWRMETSTFGSDPDEDFRDDGYENIRIMVVQKVG